jgi:hypothetical protein
MSAKPGSPKELVAEIHKEIGGKQPLAYDQIERNIERAQALLRWLKEERDRRTTDKTPAGEVSASPTGSSPVETQRGKLPKRDAIVAMLEQLGMASPPARIAALAEELLGVQVSASQFASFRKADERSYRRNPRNRVYVLPALSAMDLSGMSGSVTLSSWPLERRVIGGYSQRVDAMRALLAADAAYRERKDPAARAILRIITREYPRLAPFGAEDGALARLAAAEVEALGPRDAEERGAAAARAAHLDQLSQLFGRPPLAVIAGSSS